MKEAVSDIRISELKDMISSLQVTISTLNDSIKQLNEQLVQKDLTISEQKARIDWLSNKVFGSHSEKQSGIPGQIFMNADGEIICPDNDEASAKAEEDLAEEIIHVEGYDKKKRKPKATYDEQFENLKVKKEYVDELPEDERICPVCGKVMEKFGEKVIRDEVIYEPAKLYRKQTIARSYKCPDSDSEDENLILHDHYSLVPPLIEGSFVSSGLAAHVMYYKYVMAMPLYRQEQDFSRLGAKISRATMGNWVITCSQQYLTHVCAYMKKELLKRQFLMADETPMQVLKEEGRRAQQKSYVWVIRTGQDRGHPIILYRYTQTRAGANAREFFADAAGDFYLMTDGYKGYNKVKNGKRCSCWAHIRRYWLKAVPKDKKKDLSIPAVQGLMYIEKLYRYEKMYREKGYSPEEIHDRRLKDEEPVIDAFLAWMDKLVPKTGDQIIKAITYTNGCRPYLKNYLQDGRCSFDNNWSENAIRPVVMGRKNWLFADTPEGAEASMVIYSLVETAKANGLDPEKYLGFVLEARPGKDTPDEEMEKLMPWQTAAQEKCQQTSKKEEEQTD